MIEWVTHKFSSENCFLILDSLAEAAETRPGQRRSAQSLFSEQECAAAWFPYKAEAATHLVLVPLLVGGDDEFGHVRDELVALGLPQRLHTHLQVLHQHLLHPAATTGQIRLD